MFWSCKDIDIIGDMRKQQVMIIEANILNNALMVKCDGVSFKVHIELHILEEILAHLVYKEHYELVFVVLEHGEIIVGLEGNGKELL